MTYANAISNIVNSSSNNATKIPRWHGYIYRTTTGLSDADIELGKFRLVYVKSSGDQYIFLWDGVADYSYEGYLANSSGSLASLSETPVSATPLVLDADLQEALTYDTWETNTQSYYDGQRTNEGAWD